jgi:hypothetical protein
MHYTHRQTHYHITIVQFPECSIEPELLTLDGVPQIGNAFPLESGGGKHAVEMKFRVKAAA